jgi:hypothetical protein
LRQVGVLTAKAEQYREQQTAIEKILDAEKEVE